ncbi:hypothetical protein [Frigoribacterium sp. VKM Ac-2836]|uniref:hypothetical protein n=1 Tax=Frigoribacterium sp. VKM Ac-2836 TaxID=2739014 RepID=UPI0015636B02|nr:hypothetical protein [Frigoribacterium sp. VKM Ac-2836]NRD25850.1 hypothetical protein [Frigoribacterium sp. VKM Ac-2836]
MNKTAIFICFSALAAVGLVGSVVLAIHRPDATATFTSLIVTVLGLAATAAGTFYALGKQGEKIDTIKTQTNGTLSKLREDNERLNREAIERAQREQPPAEGRHRADPES